MTPEFTPLTLAGLLQAAMSVPFSMRANLELGSGYPTFPRHDTRMDP